MSVAGAREYAATATLPQSAKEIIEQLCQEIEALDRLLVQKAAFDWAIRKNPHDA